ncbi:MAG: hypothetical protein IJB79_00185 [Candidatus Gastranaerophilales bacterium]|nr:hypothetical protein [Candidatus Gastranaerophilales bacterium]
MYYNIKIKSNGSEFSLETSHKEVLEREMDLYFACVFNVSEEFKSKIKKVEITNENVKSIDEVEAKEETKIEPQKTQEEKIEELAQLKAQELIKAQQAKIEELEKKAQELIAKQEENLKTQEIITHEAPQPSVLSGTFKNEPEITPIPTQAPPEPTEPIPTPSPIIKFQNEPTIINIKNYKEPAIIKEEVVSVSQMQTTEAIQEVCEPINDIEELINLAQKKIDSLENIDSNILVEPTQTNETSPEEAIQIEEIVEIKNNELKFEEPISQEENTSELIFQEPIDYEEKKEEQPTQEEENEIQTPLVFDGDSPINSSMPEILPDITLADIELSLQSNLELKQEENTPTISQEPANEVSQYSLNIETTQAPIQNQKQEEIDELPVSESLIQPQRTPLSAMASQIDFKPFLMGFACEELADEFLVCAYFIKNVLKQNDFTMKYINSKLFQATGKIADMSVIDELISKEYIRVIDTEEGKKYSITMDGEGHFAEKFQG